MTPFGKNYRWRNTMRFLMHYMARRLLGAVAKLLDRMGRRERERRAQLRAHREDAREGQHHPQRSQDAPGPHGTTASTHSLTDTAIGPIRGTQEVES